MSRDRFEVSESFRFLGRTFAEYRHLFDLGPAVLSGSVLDCPGGPSSFAAVASALGIDVVAVDPMYAADVETLDTACRDAIEATLAQLREKRDLFSWSFYGDVATRGQYLRTAANRFLAAFARHPGRYVAGALPDLPFETNAFDRVLSGNFLFLYDDRLDRSFHVDALGELARVAREEVRVFPLASLDTTRSEYVDPVVATLREDGHAVEYREVPYEFQPDVTEMLVVRP